MSDYLIFQLATSIASMGDLAGHERRGSLLWPGRSALIGLMGAALGIRRDGDFSELDQLQMAVAIFDEGHVLRDYHTIETIPSAKARNPQSRPEALRIAGRETNTTITHRDYRTGSLFGVAVWGSGLGSIRDALQHPSFTLYLGRKSCTLSAPLDPGIVTADDPAMAMAQLRLPSWRKGAQALRMACDGADAPQMTTRHDNATDRTAWHFSLRQVAILPVDIRPEIGQ